MSRSRAARIAQCEVLVEVSDKNDNAPVFVNTPYHGVVLSRARKGQTVFNVSETFFKIYFLF